jgi:segregation and condensation protein B
LSSDYAGASHGIEIRQVASGYRMSTKPEHHDVVRAFAKSLKPPIRLSMPALETLAVIAYKQPVTVPEISEIRGVDSGGVIATLLDRKLISTAGRKAVIGRPILYKTTKEFLLRFGLKDVSELPSMEEFEKLVAESFQSDLLPATDGDEGDDSMGNGSGGSVKNDGVGGKHGKPSPGHGNNSDDDTVEVEVDIVATEIDELEGEDGDGVAGQHGKPSNS